VTLVGLFSGAKPAATPVGSATTTDGGADFAALLGAVAAPLLFAGPSAPASPPATTVAAAPAPPTPAPLTPSEIQENGAPPAAATPVIPGVIAAPADQTPEFAKGVVAEAVVAAPAVAAVAPSVSETPAAPPAPAPAKTKKGADAVDGVVAAAPIAAPVTPATVTSVVLAPAPPAPTAHPDAAPAAPVIQAITAPPAADATPAPAPLTVTVSGVEVELVVTSVPEKPAAVKQATQDVSGAAAAAVVAAPVGGGVASAAPVAAASAPAPVAAPTFSDQVAKPLFTLAAGPAGDHVVTVKVTPDNLGPVTVRAHVGPEGMRVELFAPNDAGREAIRSILPDLRRDLAGQGVAANLDLSSQSQPFDRGGDTSARDRPTSQNLPGRQDAAPRDSEQPSRRNHTATSMLDVLA
jgi:flagellar hook-length control protein FliK